MDIFLDKNCQVCGDAVRKSYFDWIVRCHSCRHKQGVFHQHEAQFDRDMHESAHEATRKKTYATMLNQLSKKYQLMDQEILDIGCSYGWFLEVANAYGMKAFGIEPDVESVEVAERKGLSVSQGYFPNVLDSGSQFDWIVFNDVFEHISDVNVTLSQVKAFLKPGGRLILNLPSSQGFLYRTAQLMAYLGFKMPLERLWLKMSPWPHLHYFSPKTLDRLLMKHGFKKSLSFNLPSIYNDNLWKTLCIDKGVSRLKLIPVYLLLKAFYYIQKILPADIQVVVYDSPT